MDEDEQLTLAIEASLRTASEEAARSKKHRYLSPNVSSRVQVVSGDDVFEGTVTEVGVTEPVGGDKVDGFLIMWDDGVTVSFFPSSCDWTEVSASPSTPMAKGSASPPTQQHTAQKPAQQALPSMAERKKHLVSLADYNTMASKRRRVTRENLKIVNSIKVRDTARDIFVPKLAK
jgi:hypothetical protein